MQKVNKIMKVQSIKNNSYNTNFQKLVIKNPQDMPTNIYKAFVENDSIQFLTKKMHNKGVDLIASYEPSRVHGAVMPPKINLENVKQFFNRYFKYSETPYNKKFSEFYTIGHRRYPSEEDLLEELNAFDAYDVREAVHNDVKQYFNAIKAEKAKKEIAEKLGEFNNNLNNTNEIPKTFWQKLFKTINRLIY